MRSSSSLAYYSVDSAFNDSRFEPLTKDEVPSLACAVSLLHKFEAAANVWDWKVQIFTGLIVEKKTTISFYSQHFFF